MIEALQNILKKFVVKPSDRLYDVDVYELKGTVVVLYHSWERIDYSDAFKYERETKDLFRMVGFDKGTEIEIKYKVDE